MLKDKFNDLTLNDLIGLDENLGSTLKYIVNQQIKIDEVESQLKSES